MFCIDYYCYTSKLLCRSVIRADKHNVVETPGLEKTSGELLVKSPFLFKSYYNNPKATSESFIDGRLRNSNVGRRVEFFLAAMH